jgi:alkylation response protein AidB-like acyl-CoA dehydrogenase
MDLSFSTAEEAFRQEVRAFFATDYPASVVEKVRRGDTIDRAAQELAQRALNARGWLGYAWPAPFGPGWTATQRYIFEEEGERAGMAPLSPTSLFYIGPILCAFGSPEQQRDWLPDILESRTFWAQGYSEPEAGSDLASLRMTAVRDGDDYILDGTKIWTSYAHYADWIFCLVRTSKEARKQDGMSLICCDLCTPGITIHPIVTMDGEVHLNRISFDQVRVPASGLIGEEGKGWHYATVLLQNERLSYAHMGRKKADLAELRERALGGEAGKDLAFMARINRAEIELRILEISVFRALSGEITAAAVSALKIRFTELAQMISELQRLYAVTWHASARSDGVAGKSAASYLFERAATIYGGATEIQKTIMWRQIGA